MKPTLSEFAAKLAEAFSKSAFYGAPGATATSSGDGGWIVGWPQGGKVYSYVLTGIADQPDQVQIRMDHPAFSPGFECEVVITVNPDADIQDILRDIDERMVRRVPEVGHKADRVRWNTGLTAPEIDWNNYREDELKRLWTALHALGSGHPLFIHEITVPSEPGGGGRVCDFFELEAIDFDPFEIAYCLGYIHHMLDDAEEDGDIEDLFGVETWREALLGGEVPSEESEEEP